MPETEERTSLGLEGPREFCTTHWSQVLAAGQEDSSLAKEAIEKLCRAYWYPLYAFIRRRGHDPHDARDLTQELFYRLIERRSFQVADQSRGRFRSFLLACAQNLLNQQWRKEGTAKRGGGCSFISFDEELVEARYQTELVDSLSPERLFERRWAMNVLDRAMENLQDEYATAGKGAQFEALQVFLSGTKGVSDSYAEVGARLGIGESAARQAAYRMRCRFGELVRLEVAQTVTNTAEFEDEMRHLRAVLSG